MQKTRLAPEDLQAALSGFTGTEGYTRLQRCTSRFPGLLLTDGAHYLAEQAQAYWLFDIVWSVSDKIMREGFGNITLTLAGRGATFVLDDGNGKILYTQDISFTDFPLPEIKLFVAPADERELVVMLPSEY